MPININQLEKADAQNKLPVSNNTGVLEFSLLSSGYFTTTSNTVKVKPQVFAEDAGTGAPIVAATPSSPPATAADDAILLRKYNDLVRIWIKTSGTWAHAFDI